MKLSRKTYRRVVPTVVYLIMNSMFVMMMLTKNELSMNGDIIPMTIGVVFATLALISIQIEISTKENLGDFKRSMYLVSFVPGMNFIVISLLLVFGFFAFLGLLITIFEYFENDIIKD